MAHGCFWFYKFCIDVSVFLFGIVWKLFSCKKSFLDFIYQVFRLSITTSKLAGSNWIGIWSLQLSSFYLQEIRIFSIMHLVFGLLSCKYFWYFGEMIIFDLLLSLKFLVFPTILGEETIAKETFAEEIFPIYDLNRKNFFRKIFQNWSVAKISSAKPKFSQSQKFISQKHSKLVNRKNLFPFFIKKPQQLRST